MLEQSHTAFMRSPRLCWFLIKDFGVFSWRLKYVVYGKRMAADRRFPTSNRVAAFEPLRLLIRAFPYVWLNHL